MHDAIYVVNPVSYNHNEIVLDLTDPSAISWLLQMIGSQTTEHLWAYVGVGQRAAEALWFLLNYCEGQYRPIVSPMLRDPIFTGVPDWVCQVGRTFYAWAITIERRYIAIGSLDKWYDKQVRVTHANYLQLTESQHAYWFVAGLFNLEARDVLKKICSSRLARIWDHVRVNPSLRNRLVDCVVAESIGSKRLPVVGIRDCVPWGCLVEIYTVYGRPTYWLLTHDCGVALGNPKIRSVSGALKLLGIPRSWAKRRWSEVKTKLMPRLLYSTYKVIMT